MTIARIVTMRVLILCTALFSILTLSLLDLGPRTLGQEQFLTYRDTKDMFTIQYPGSWEKKENQSGGVSFYIPETPAVFSIYVQSLEKLEDLYNTEVSSLEQFVDRNVQYLQGSYFGNRLIPDGLIPTTINNQSAFRAESEPGTGSSPASRDKMLHFWALVGDSAYTFTFRAREPIYLEYLPTIERMIETFRLLNISAATPRTTQVNENSLTEQEVVQSTNKTTLLSSAPLTGWKTFRDGNLSIQLQYPPDWVGTSFENANGQNRGLNFTSNSTTTSNVPSFFVINVTDKRNDDKTISQLVDSVTTSVDNITQENLVTFSGLPAYEIIYLKQTAGPEKEDIQLKITDLITNSKDKTYQIRYGSDVEDVLSFSIFKKVLATFKIGNLDITNQAQKQESLPPLQQPFAGLQQQPSQPYQPPMQQQQPMQQQPQQNPQIPQLYPPPPAQQQQWSTYRDPSGIFAISYPPNWISDPIEDGLKTFRAPAETFSDRYEINAAVSVSGMGLPSQANTLQALTDHRLQMSPNVIQSQATTLAGLPAHMIMKELSLSPFLVDIGMGSNQMMLEVWTVKDSMWYHITFMTPADKFHQYLPIAQQMIDSFQISS